LEQHDVLRLFEKHNALLSGHFKLSSGLHSAKYLQCALVLQHPPLAEKLAKALAAKFSGDSIGVVVGPALGGVTFAYEVARVLGARGIFTERVDGAMALRRGFSVNKGERVLVVEDVITTGGSTKEVIEVVKTLGGKLAGVGCIIDRSDAPVDFGARKEHLAKIKVETFAPEDCALCRSGEPVVKPGSRKAE
jgi:orotate phosphoribosyltransferase